MLWHVGVWLIKVIRIHASENIQFKLTNFHWGDLSYEFSSETEERIKCHHLWPVSFRICRYSCRFHGAIITRKRFPLYRTFTKIFLIRVFIVTFFTMNYALLFEIVRHHVDDAGFLIIQIFECLGCGDFDKMIGKTTSHYLSQFRNC